MPIWRTCLSRKQQGAILQPWNGGAASDGAGRSRIGSAVGPTPVFPQGSTEFSVHYDTASRRYLQVRERGIRRVRYRPAECGSTHRALDSIAYDLPPAGIRWTRSFRLRRQGAPRTQRGGSDCDLCREWERQPSGYRPDHLLSTICKGATREVRNTRDRPRSWRRLSGEGDAGAARTKKCALPTFAPQRGRSSLTL
jgi:hypothetical protein